jgi:hypothetical protein
MLMTSHADLAPEGLVLFSHVCHTPSREEAGPSRLPVVPTVARRAGGLTTATAGAVSHG